MQPSDDAIVAARHFERSYDAIRLELLHHDICCAVISHKFALLKRVVLIQGFKGRRMDKIQCSLVAIQSNCRVCYNGHANRMREERAVKREAWKCGIQSKVIPIQHQGSIEQLGG
jgi:hypothetical protein